MCALECIAFVMLIWALLSITMVLTCGAMNGRTKV